MHIFFFFNDTATTEIYTLSLHDALPIYHPARRAHRAAGDRPLRAGRVGRGGVAGRHRPRGRRLRLHGEGLEPGRRSEEHTSELQSRQYLVCRLLLEKKKIKKTTVNYDR